MNEGANVEGIKFKVNDQCLKLYHECTFIVQVEVIYFHAPPLSILRYYNRAGPF